MFNDKERWFPIGIFRSQLIAFKNLFRPAMTIRYPHERAHIPERARWAVEINYASDGSHRCTACKVCEKECPDFLIALDVDIAEDRSRHIKSWHYRRGGCMMCGLCVEVCPFDAIKMGHDYELAHVDPDLLEYDLLTGVPAYKRPRKPRPERPAAAAKPKPTENDKRPAESEKKSKDESGMRTIQSTPLSVSADKGSDGQTPPKTPSVEKPAIKKEVSDA